MKIFIAGGGTGGHLYPAISIIESLLEKNKNIKIYYFGNSKSLEERVVSTSDLNITFIPLKTSGFFNKPLKIKIISFYNLIISFFEVNNFFKKIRPDFVIGTGGYVSGPVLIAAIFNKIPYALQEQNIIPGVANQILSRFAKYVFLGFKESSLFFKDKTNLVWTGNPVRKKFYLMSNDTSSAIENEIVIIGGSGGARSINLLIPEVYENMKKQNIKFLHITGVRDYERVLDLVKDKHYENYEILPYVHNIWDRLKKAKLVICRSGAITISEILLLKKPLLLIPYPFAVRNHQYWNAYKYKKLGIAELLLDIDLKTGILISKINKFIYNEKFYNSIMNNYQKLKIKNSSKIIVDKIIEK